MRARRKMAGLHANAFSTRRLTRLRTFFRPALPTEAGPARPYPRLIPRHDPAFAMIRAICAAIHSIMGKAVSRPRGYRDRVRQQGKVLNDIFNIRAWCVYRPQVALIVDGP